MSEKSLVERLDTNKAELRLGLRRALQRIEELESALGASDNMSHHLETQNTLLHRQLTAAEEDRDCFFADLRDSAAQNNKLEAEKQLPWWHEAFDREKHKVVRVSVQTMDSLDRVDDELVAALERCEELSDERDEALEALRKLFMATPRSCPWDGDLDRTEDWHLAIASAERVLSARGQEEKHG